MKSGKRTRDAKIQTLPEIIGQTRIEHVGTQCMLIGGPSVDKNTQTSDPAEDATMEPASSEHAATDPIPSGDVTMDSTHSSGNTMEADVTERESMMDETWTFDGAQQEEMEKIQAQLNKKDCH